MIGEMVRMVASTMGNATGSEREIVTTVALTLEE